MATIRIVIPDHKRRNIDLILEIARRLGIEQMNPPEHLSEATAISFPFPDTEEGNRLSREFSDSIPIDWYS